MTRDVLIAQILAQIPDCPHYLASAYLLEFTERIKTEGKIERVDLDSYNNQGYSVDLPDNVISVQNIYIDGKRANGDMGEDWAMSILHSYPDYVLADEDNNIILDESDNQIAI